MSDGMSKFEVVECMAFAGGFTRIGFHCEELGDKLGYVTWWKRASTHNELSEWSPIFFAGGELPFAESNRIIEKYNLKTLVHLHQ